jgi:hypothetical protein
MLHILTMDIKNENIIFSPRNPAPGALEVFCEVEINMVCGRTCAVGRTFPKEESCAIWLRVLVRHGM